MLKPEKRKELLAFLATETSLAKLDSKPRAQSDNPEMESQDDTKQVCAELSRMIVTVQPAVNVFFGLRRPAGTQFSKFMPSSDPI